MTVGQEKRPRQYAAEILALEASKRRAALEQVPEWCRPWVESYIRDAIWRRRNRKQGGNNV